MKAQPAILEPRASATLDDYVTDLAWSGDGTRLAIAGGEGRVFLARHDAGSSSLAVRELGEHLMGALAVAWRPKAESFVTSGQDNAIAFWDGTSGAEQRRIRPAMAWTEHLAWSPDGMRLASAAGKQLTLWSPEGEKQHAFAPHAGAVSALGWDKPGRDLAAATNGAMVIHRIEPPRYVSRHYKWPASCQTVAFSPNGRVIASGMQDGSLHFWYLSNARDSQMRGYPGKVNLTSWSGDSRWLASNAANEVVCWDFSGKGPEGSRPVQLSGHTDRIGKRAYNMKLSQRRAEAVKRYLVTKYLRPEVIETSGVGPDRPVTKPGDCANMEFNALIGCLQPDRRVEIAVRGAAPTKN
mgnify:CR=1 FL=1